MIKDALFSHAVIQARPKTKASFAGKILRKIDKYKNSTSKPTDLCGGRVVVHTKNEVARISEFIRTHFEIDEANSLDSAERLQASEFGYRSVHLIVSLSEAKLRAMPLS